MAIELAYQIKIRAKDAEGKQRTLTFSPMVSQIDDEENLNRFAQKLQPLLIETISAAECYRIRSIKNYESTVEAGVDALPDSTKDSTIYKLTNATGTRLVTIANSASAAESDTTAFTAYSEAVYNFATELTSYYDGDYSVDDVTLRSIYDTQIEDPS